MEHHWTRSGPMTFSGTPRLGTTSAIGHARVVCAATAGPRPHSTPFALMQRPAEEDVRPCNGSRSSSASPPPVPLGRSPKRSSSPLFALDPKPFQVGRSYGLLQASDRPSPQASIQGRHGTPVDPLRAYDVLRYAPTRTYLSSWPCKSRAATACRRPPATPLSQVQRPQAASIQGRHGAPIGHGGPMTLTGTPRLGPPPFRASMERQSAVDRPMTLTGTPRLGPPPFRAAMERQSAVEGL